MKALPLLLLGLLLCLGQPLLAQYRLSGKIYSKETQEALQGTLVYIPDLQRTAFADSLGQYKFENLPKGRYVISIHLLDYAAQNITVTVDGDTRQDVVMEPTQLEAKEIVITGVSHATELRRSPMAVALVNNDYLIKNASTNIIDALTRIPGVSQISTGAGISKPVIRGMSYNRVVTLYDGIRQEGQQWGDEHGIEIDEYNVDHVEILKGPASLMYGSDAIGGVLNFLPPPVLQDSQIRGSIQSEYQTNNGLYAASAALAGNLNGFNWNGRFTHKQAGNYQNSADGRVFNSGFAENDGSLTAGITRNWGFTRLSGSIFDQTLALPEGDRDSATGKFLKPVKLNDTTAGTAIAGQKDLNSYKLSFPNQHIQHYRIYSSSHFVVGNGALNLNVGYQYNIRREYGDILEPATPSLRMDLQTLTYDLRYFFPEVKGWETSAGFNGMSQDNSNKGAELIIPDYSLTDEGIFLLEKKSWKHLDISGGIRYDYREVSSHNTNLQTGNTPPDQAGSGRFTTFKAHFDNISGSVGASYLLSDRFILKANIARGFRAPNMAELASNGQHEGTFRYEIGDNNLKPEISVQEDLGLSYHSRHISLDVSVFNNNVSNYIYLQKIPSHLGKDSVIDPAAPDAPAYHFVQGQAQLYGGEIALDIHPHPLDWLHFENTFATVYTRNLSSTNAASRYLPFTPAPMFRSTLQANFSKKGRRLRNGYVRLEAEHYFAQDRVLLEANTETPTPAYTLFNAGLGFDIMSKGGKELFNFNILASNFTDVAYQSHLSRLKYAGFNYATGQAGIYNMGRNVIFKLNVPITFLGHRS